MGPDCTIDDLAAWLRATDAFTNWNGLTVHRIMEVKPYRVPGNAARWRDLPAVWIRSAQAKRSKILMLDGLRAAIHYLAHPAWRGAS